MILGKYIKKRGNRETYRQKRKIVFCAIFTEHTHTQLFLQTWWPFLQNWCWFERKDLARQMATEKKWQNHKNNLCAKVCRWRIHANMIFPPFCTLKNLFLHNKRLYFALVFSVLPDNYFGNKVHQSSRKPCQQKKNVSRKRRSFRLFRNKKKGKYVVAKDLTRETATEKMLAKPQKWFAHKIFVLRECTHTRPWQHSAFCFAHEKNLVLESDFEREQIISEVETLKKKSKNAINWKRNILKRQVNREEKILTCVQSFLKTASPIFQ